MISIGFEEQAAQESNSFPMFLKGQELRGHRFVYRLIEPLATQKQNVQSVVWKAKILDSDQYKKPAELAIVKTASWDRYEWLERERDAYGQPSINKSLYIRSMYDEINELRRKREFRSEEAFQDAVEKEPWCLVLEFLDHSLDGLAANEYKQNLVFVAEFFKSTLTAASDIEQAKAVWTDGKPENILCSEPNRAEPVIKIADMGLVGPKGFDKRQLQPKQTRAPEVWSGHPCNPVADIWSIGATFVSWVDEDVFGPRDLKLGFPAEFEDSWCIAKILRGFETSEDKMPAPPLNADQHIKYLYKLGIDLLTQKDDKTEGSMHVPAQPFFAEVLPKLGLASEVGALLRRMLVLDPNKRWTAKILLQSQEYRNLLAAAAVWSAVNLPEGESWSSTITSQIGNIQIV